VTASIRLLCEIKSDDEFKSPERHTLHPQNFHRLIRASAFVFLVTCKGNERLWREHPPYHGRHSNRIARGVVEGAMNYVVRIIGEIVAVE
jgi:hypothetical protein